MWRHSQLQEVVELQQKQIAETEEAEAHAGVAELRVDNVRARPESARSKAEEPCSQFEAIQPLLAELWK